MPWSEFSNLLQGIGAKTPLGIVVGIRTESDPDILKSFTREQKLIRADWRSKQARKLVKNNPDYAKQQVRAFQTALKEAFSK